MKVCKGNELLINQYIDGELSPEEEKALRAHLDVCPACRAYYEQLCFISDEMLDIDIPKDLHASIMTAVNDSRESDKKIIRFRKPAYIGIIAAVLMVALVGVMGIGGHFDPGIRMKSADNSAVESADKEISEAESECAAEQDIPAYGAGTMKDLAETIGENGRKYTIEDTMTGWFASDSQCVTVIEEAPENESVVTDGSTDRLFAAKDRAEELSDTLEKETEGYGFYIVAMGSADGLPDIFADRAENLEPGMTLLINVKNDPCVKEQIVCSMTESGFDVFDDSEGEYFTPENEAAEGLVIVGLED